LIVIASILYTVEDLGQASATHQYTPETLSSIIAALVSIELRCSGYIHVELELWSDWPRIQSRRQLKRVIIDPTKNIDIT
jgi:hypothetical protein